MKHLYALDDDDDDDDDDVMMLNHTFIFIH